MIEVRNLQKKYGRKRILEDVSFTAESGQVTCLLGINGVGKSTTLKAIMGLIPFKGEILIDGEKIKPALYEKISFVPDQQIMFPGMKIKEAFAFMADFYDSWNQEKAEEMLAFFELDANTKIADLSQGNKSKINLTIGLAQKAKYILMDEPFSGIDIFSREQILNVLTSDLLEEDQGVILTTHEIAEIEYIADKVVLIDNGKVTKEFVPEDERETDGRSIADVMREVYGK